MSRGDDLWFAFAGVESPDMGVRLARLPAIPSAEARGTAVKIPGRDGALWLPEDAFGEVEIRLEIELGPEAELEAAEKVFPGAVAGRDGMTVTLRYPRDAEPAGLEIGRKEDW